MSNEFIDKMIKNLESMEKKLNSLTATKGRVSNSNEENWGGLVLEGNSGRASKIYRPF